jgi:predicted nucleic acid-binding protein
LTVLYADTSALVRAYLVDESDHAALRALLLEGDSTVISSEIARVEFARAVAAAERAGRLRSADTYVARFDDDCSRSRRVGLVELEPGRVLPLAHTLVQRHRLATLDALHLAVAIQEPEPDLAFVTRDADQALAARELGLTVL